MLPKIVAPSFPDKLPSTGESVRYRTMTAREEKVLLMAKESKSPADVLDAVLQVVSACLVTGPGQDELTIFDLEWLFIKIRSVSVDNTAEVTYVDHGDGQERKFTIDLNKVVVRFPEPAPESKIDVGDGMVVELRWPRAELYADAELIESREAEAMERLLARCVSRVYDRDQVYDASEVPPDEMLEWVRDLPLEAYEKAVDFLVRVPHVFYEIDYVNASGDERKITLTALSDFFTFA